MQSDPVFGYPAETLLVDASFRGGLSNPALKTYGLIDS